MKSHIAIDSSGQGAITIIADDGTVTAIGNDHPNYLRVAQALIAEEDPFPFLTLEGAVTGVDDRLTVEDEQVTFTGKAVDQVVTETLERYRREGRDTTGIVKFLERLDANPSEASRQDLLEWVRVAGLVIDPEGFFVGWKGINHDGKSVQSGTATVNGTAVSGRIPNAVGSIISMPRDQVDDNTRVACSTGLHVGTKSYARGFGPVLLEVRVDPADAVSVPPGDNEKLRCCRYTVLAVHDDRKPAERHEPPATWTPEQAEETLQVKIPKSFVQALWARLREQRRETDENSSRK